MSVLTVALLVVITVACLHALNAYVWFLAPEARKVVSGVVATLMIIAVVVVGVMAYV